jgi:hypothetical protein
MGHVDMVKQYANNADRVIVLISAPTKNGRKLPNGSEITAAHAEKIWNLFVGGDSGIEVYTSSHASPINAAYEISGRPGDRDRAAEKMNMDPIEAGSTIILGASNKDGDAGRWAGAEKYIGDDLNLVPPTQSAVEPLTRPNGEPFSATDMRELLGDILANKEALRDFAGGDVDEVLKILGMQGIEESIGGNGNAMQVGSITGAVGARGGPWKTTDVEEENEEEKKRSKLKDTSKIVKRENLDLSTVDEVMRLIMERGISR